MSCWPGPRGGELVCPQVWVVVLRVPAGSDVTLPRRGEGEEVFPQRGLVRRAVGPELSPGLPQWAEPVLVGDGVLDDERLEPLGLRDREPESHRAAVVLHDEGVPGQRESLGETADDRGQVVEGVRELRVAGCVAVPEPGIVRCDEVGQAGSPSSSGRHMRDDEGNPCRSRIVGASCGPAAQEDGQAVDVDGAVRRAIHGLPPLASGVDRSRSSRHRGRSRTPA